MNTATIGKTTDSSTNVNSSSRAILEYSPDDFYYLTNSKDIPKNGCDRLYKITKDMCGSNLDTTDEESVHMCYQNALCQNKTLSAQLFDMQTKHTQFEAQLEDITTKYRYQMSNALYLGMGIIGTIVYVYYNK